jgi:hypothetical protein
MPPACPVQVTLTPTPGPGPAVLRTSTCPGTMISVWIAQGPLGPTRAHRSAAPQANTWTKMQMCAPTVKEGRTAQVRGLRSACSVPVAPTTPWKDHLLPPFASHARADPLQPPQAWMLALPAVSGCTTTRQGLAAAMCRHCPPPCPPSVPPTLTMRSRTPWTKRYLLVQATP